jgi:hypothetical protein
MTTSTAFHNPVITTVEVTNLSIGTWTLALKDGKNNSVTFFLSDAAQIKQLARLITTLTDAELVNPYAGTGKE